MIYILPSNYSEILQGYLAKDKGGNLDQSIFNTISYFLNNNKAQNIPGFNRECESNTQVGGPQTKKSIDGIKQLFDRNAAGEISLVLVGESHVNEMDKARAREIIANIYIGGNLQLTPSMVVFERGLEYDTSAIRKNVNVPTEEKLSVAFPGGGLGLDANQRSKVVAGYLVSCLASGDQNSNDKIMMFYGERHEDIFKAYAYFVRHTEARYLGLRKCTTLLIRSNAR